MSQYGYPARAVGGYAPSAVDRRATFIVRTYNHLFVAIAAFALLEAGLITSGVGAPIAVLLGRNWWLALGGFVAASWLGSYWAHTARSRSLQYAGLAAMVVAESIVFLPILTIANAIAPDTIHSAALVTFLGFGGLTAIAFVTRRDFSFLRGILMWAGVSALVLIVAAMVFNFTLGVFFSVAMVALAGASILYTTSNVLHHYPEDRYVAAALELFASVAMMFWYVLRIFLASRD
jgi:FtsH-binding integral membrane protein